MKHSFNTISLYKTKKITKKGLQRGIQKISKILYRYQAYHFFTPDAHFVHIRLIGGFRIKTVGRRTAVKRLAKRRTKLQTAITKYSLDINDRATRIFVFILDERISSDEVTQWYQ